eukprot:10351148-Prorocentrum_lima.AAC.1
MTRIGRPSSRSLAPMFVTLQPMDFAALMARLLFSVFWKTLMFGRVLRARSSTVSGTAMFTSLQNTRPSEQA